MDVNDLKGLFAEVNKRMKTALDHLQHEFAGVRTGRRPVSITVMCAPSIVNIRSCVRI